MFAEASEFDIIDYTYIVMATKLSKALVGNEKTVLVNRNLFYIFKTVQSATKLAVKQGVRSIVAAGGYPIATMFSSQFFEDPRALDYLAEVYEEIERVEDILTGVESIKHTAILFDSETHDKYFWRRPTIYLAELEGLTQILMSRNLPTEFITMKDLEKIRLPKSIILSDQSLRFRVERTEKELGDLIKVRPTNAKVLFLVKTTKAPYGYEYTLGRSTPPPDSNLENAAGIVLVHVGSGLVLYYADRIGHTTAG